MSLCRRGQAKRVRRGCLENSALYSVDDFKATHRALLYQAIPELSDEKRRRELIEQQNIVLDNILPDPKAQAFFDAFKKPNGAYLTQEENTKYYHSAIILNAMRRAWDNMYGFRTKSNHKMISKCEFWQLMHDNMKSICEKYINSLQWSARRLQKQAEKYYGQTEDGGNDYAALLKSGRFGNQNRAKVVSDEQKSFIIEMLRSGNNLEYSSIAKMYNVTARIKDWAEVSEATMRNWAGKYRLETYAGRHGRKELYNNKMMQVKRRRPDSPLLFWSVDGWTTELLYQKTEERNGRRVTTYHNRLTTVFVMDASIDYIIGYAIGDHETPALITEAMRTAIEHTRELFGERYRPAQIQSDHYGNGHMKPLFENACEHYTPAEAGNAKAKPVERYNADFNRDCQLMLNWSGHNVTSRKENQPNAEILNKNHKYFPDEAACRSQIERIIERRRADKREEYLQRWERADKTLFKPIDTETFLYYFGHVRLKKGSAELLTNRLTGAGVIAAIEGEKRFYDCFDLRFRQHGGEDWILRYDPQDLTRVLATNADGTLRFLLEEKYEQPMALKDRQEGDAAQLQRVREFNEQVEAHIIDTLKPANESVQGLLGRGAIGNDTLEKLLIVNSLGQHKDERNRARELAAHGEEMEIRYVKKRERKEKKVFREEYAEYINEKVDLDAYCEINE
jgi:hypothetical protein